MQVKATQIDRVSLYSEPGHLIVLRLSRDGSAEEIFNGPGDIGMAGSSTSRCDSNDLRGLLAMDPHPSDEKAGGPADDSTRVIRVTPV